MKTRLLVCAILVLSGFAWPSRASAQDTQLGTITGLTFDNQPASDQPCILVFPPPQGCGPQPLAGVRVEVFPDAQIPAAPLTAISDASGRYTIENVPLGSSTVRASVEAPAPGLFGFSALTFAPSPTDCSADSVGGPTSKIVSVDFGQSVEVNWFCPTRSTGAPGLPQFPAFPGLPSFPGFPSFPLFPGLPPNPFVPLPVDFGGGIG